MDMSHISIGSDFQHWNILKKRGEGPGYMDFLAAHALLNTEVLLRAFAPDFSENSELGKALRRFLKSLAVITHPTMPPVLDVGTVSNPDGSESPYVVLEPGFGNTPPAMKLSETPMTSREAALSFLYAMARFLLDAQSLRIGCDFLTPEDVAWDGSRVQFRALRWVAMFEEGKLPTQHGTLYGAWEKAAPSGIYPVAEERGYPRIPSLVCLGRLMYQAAGVKNPVEQLQSLKQENSDTSPLESTRSQLLVESWGCALEALVRRCLFAYDSGMLQNGEALLEATEKLLKGEVPELCRYVPMAPESSRDATSRGASSAVASSMKTGTPADQDSERSRMKSASAGDKKDESAREKTASPDNLSSSAPRPASPATKPFVPLGMEAAMLDTKSGLISAAPSRKTRRRKIKSLVKLSPEALKKVGLGLAIAAALVLLIAGAMALLSRSGSKPNQPPVAAIAPLEGTLKRIQSYTLDGSGSSDPNQDPLTYEWSVIEPQRADCSIGVNNSQAAQKTTIKFFQSGRHVIQLRVFDGKQYSEPARMEIHVQ